MPSNSFNEYTGDGTTTDFAITFDYDTTDRSTIIVRIDGITKALTTDYSFFNNTTIRFVTAPVSGEYVRIDREMNFSARPTDWQDGSIWTATDHNSEDDAGLWRDQEIKDNEGLPPSKSQANSWDAEDKRITNVATPSAAFDAVTKGYVDGMLNGGNTQTATGYYNVIYSDPDDADNPVNGINRTFIIIDDGGVTIADRSMVFCTIDGVPQIYTNWNLTSDKSGIIFLTAPASGAVVNLILIAATIPYVGQGQLAPDRIGLDEGTVIMGGACDCGAQTNTEDIPISVWGEAEDDLDMGGNLIADLGTPVASTDAATKGYVDSTAAAQGNFPELTSDNAYNTLDTAIQNDTTGTQCISAYVIPATAGLVVYELQIDDNSGFSSPTVIDTGRSPSDAVHYMKLIGFVPAGQYWRISRTTGSTSFTIRYQKAGPA